MQNAIQIVGDHRTLQLFGIRLVGVNAENAKKLIVTLVFLFAIYLLTKALNGILRLIFGKREDRARFWTRQGIRLLSAAILILGLLSIWFNNPTQLASFAAFITAGLAIASQRLITAIAGYFIILRGKNFNVGDRIVMGGVRGDVIALGFMQTTIMEMGQPPSEQGDAPSMWVASRQYTGRIVTITNDKIFDNPVYNYSTDFPYIWEEMHVPIPYDANRKEAERIILDAARTHTTRIAELGEDALKDLERRYAVKREELEPRVYFRITDNWVEMSVRFVVPDHGIRGIKEKVSRDILDGLDRVKIGIASGTYQIVGMPDLRVHIDRDGQ